MIDDIEKLLVSHGIKYQKRGDVIKCLCPNKFHNDKHIGSFSFDVKKGLGYCFACGFKVNTYKFNKILGEKLNDVDFNFFKKLRPNLNTTVEYQKPIIYGKLYLPKYDNEVMNFLCHIGFSDKFIDEKEIKFCRYCEMISENNAKDVNERPTMMQDRIVIPVYKDGNLVNYECRSFKNEFPKVKYVSGCSSNLLYNFDNIDLNTEVVLTESIKNLGKGWNVTKNIISSFGNQITDVKIKMLNKIPKLVVFLDYDKGGLIMLKKLKNEYKGDLRVTFCPEKYYDSDGNLKGKDMNDCTLDEIKYYLENTMSVDKAERLMSFDDNGMDSVFWK